VYDKKKDQMKSNFLLCVLLMIFFIGLILLITQYKQQEQFQHLIQILSNGDLYWWPSFSNSELPKLQQSQVLPSSLVLPKTATIGNVQPYYVKCQRYPELCQELTKPYRENQQRYAYNPNEYPFNMTWAS
jgi:hypothetical protein